MKNIICILFACLVFTGCSEENSTSRGEILGEWKLMEGRIFGFGSDTIVDYSDQEVIYDFNWNGTFTVSGGDNIGYSNGTYQFEFTETDVSAPSDPEVIARRLTVGIFNWAYNFDDNRFTMSLEYVDGPTLIFERQ